MENYISVSFNQKEACINILITDKIDVKLKGISKDEENHYTIVNASIQMK